MKKLFSIILLLFSYPILAQEIDTAQVKLIRYEWRIDKKSKDSTLAGTLKEYKSGLFKIERERLSDEKSPFGSYYISGPGYETKKESPEFKYIVITVGNTYRRNYFDEYGYLDSIYQESYIDGQKKKWNIKIEKKYKRKGKLEYLIDADGNRNIYSYNAFGKLKRIEQFKDSVLNKISFFKNNDLTSEKFPTRRKYKKDNFYEYDKKHRIVKRDDDDYDCYRYFYNSFGIERIERIYKKRNAIMEYRTFKYNAQGQLIKQYFFGHKNKLQSEYHYTYK
ncbi:MULTISPECIES: hypothetical protein [unclassified Cellulophaga]|uniref:hypothetical protein n=1 Tax=unclassified Cellulophaga TaxID=2634405 RepID=UPI0026E3A8FD|nr:MULTISPECIES: hypothetical protein [unclassified Cellulophaga]MDO6492443.1 hypothetical protein [Cellulophaga sp. 2_MG-2023]MDO6496057.1 hypothetical protein [Cellulophaga sp. 3_MG-2023]